LRRKRGRAPKGRNVGKGVSAKNLLASPSRKGKGQRSRRYEKKADRLRWQDFCHGGPGKEKELGAGETILRQGKAFSREWRWPFIKRNALAV